MLPDGPTSSGTQQALTWFARPYDFLRQCRDAHGDDFVVDLGTYGRFVILSDPAAVRDVFTAEVTALDAGEGNGVLRPFLGSHSLLLLEGTDHLRERRLLLPAFRGERVNEHGALIREVAERCISSWESDTVLSMQDAMQSLTLEVILRAVFGFFGDPRAHAEARQREVAELVRAFLDDPKFNLGLIGRLDDELEKLPAWQGFRARLAKIRELLDLEIAERRDSSHRGGDVLSMLLEARYDDGTAMNAVALRDELLTLLVTGYETTATSLAWALHWLDREPVVRETLTAAVTGLPEGDILDHPYLDGFVREVLRIHPIIPIVARRTKRPMKVGRWSLPEGTMVAPCIYLVHHREELYPEPERLLPERFTTRRYAAHEYLPFGGGARRCLGMGLALAEMKIVLAYMLRSCSFRGMDGDRRTPVRRSVTIAPGGGTRMRVTRAEDA